MLFVCLSIKIFINNLVVVVVVASAAAAVTHLKITERGRLCHMHIKCR